MKNTPARILARVVPSDGCWTVGKNTTGWYTTVRYAGRSWKAHRLVYTLLRGPIPDGMDLMHSCDNRPCVNPDHLSPGTARDNIADSLAKGRFHVSTARRDAEAVRASSESIPELARRYGVSIRTIYRVRRAA